MSRTQTIVSWVCRIIAAVILLQTLYFKFTGAPESIYIFTTVHAEPVGRIGSGVIELIASILMFVPRTVWLGAGLALGTMAGAIFSHLTLLGIEVMGDKGELFALACITFTCSAIVLFIYRRDIPFLGAKLG